jgi:hypothetical protein
MWTDTTRGIVSEESTPYAPATSTKESATTRLLQATVPLVSNNVTTKYNAASPRDLSKIPPGSEIQKIYRYDMMT